MAANGMAGDPRDVDPTGELPNTLFARIRSLLPICVLPAKKKAMAPGDEHRRSLLPKISNADRTSELPTNLLAHILSLLPLRSALACGAASKAWLAALRELQARASSLDFGTEFSKGLPPEEYARTVCRWLALHEAPTIDALRFAFSLGKSNQFFPSVESWVKLASSKQVKELEFHYIGFNPPTVELYCFAIQAFHWAYLTRLSLTLWYHSTFFEPSNLPSLQELSLHKISLQPIADFLEKCPNLAALKLTQCHGRTTWINISCPPCLRSLRIVSCVLAGIIIDAPMLKCFHFHGQCTQLVHIDQAYMMLLSAPSIGDWLLILQQERAYLMSLMP